MCAVLHAHHAMCMLWVSVCKREGQEKGDGGRHNVWVRGRCCAGGTAGTRHPIYETHRILGVRGERGVRMKVFKCDRCRCSHIGERR